MNSGIIVPIYLDQVDPIYKHYNLRCLKVKDIQLKSRVDISRYTHTAV